MAKLNKQERELIEEENRVKANYIHAVADLDSEVAATTLELVMFRLKSMVDVGNPTISTELIVALIQEVEDLIEPDVIEDIIEEEDEEEGTDELVLLTDFLPIKNTEDDNY